MLFRSGRALRTKKSDDRDAINAVSELIAEVGIGKRLGDVGATSAHYGAWEIGRAHV
ncbi:hypothetical protein EC026C_50080 [Escherichia coli]